MWNGVGKLRAALGGCFLLSPQSHRSNTESLFLEDVSFSPLERGFANENSVRLRELCGENLRLLFRILFFLRLLGVLHTHLAEGQ